MASPPFTPDETLPQPTDLISQYPTQSQNYRDIMESWMLVNHDTDGEHFRIDLPEGAHLTPVAGSQLIYATTGGVWLQDNDAGATGPILNLYHNSASPADADNIGQIVFSGEDSGGNITSYGRIHMAASDVTDTTEDGTMTLQVMAAGTLTSRLAIDAGGVDVTGTLAVTGALTASAGATVTGTVTATTFSGSGASLTSIPQAAVTGLTTALADKADNDISMVAGNGLSGGGTLGATRTFTVGEGTGISVGADTVSVDSTVWRDANVPSASQIGGIYSDNTAATIGTYGLMKRNNGTTEGPNGTVAGSQLVWCSIDGDVGAASSGTWRCYGTSAGATGTNSSGTLWMRIS